MKATCFKSETTVSNDFPPLFVTIFCGIFYPFISIPVSFGTYRSLSYKLHAKALFCLLLLSCQDTFLPSMVLDNSNSPCHTEEELWLQVLSLSRELQDCKASLHHNTLDCISDKIEGIERELDVLLDILQGRQDKKTS